MREQEPEQNLEQFKATEAPDNRSEAVKNVEALRTNAEIFWKEYLAEYFKKNNEYPPLFNEQNVRQFIALRRTRDAVFNQGVAQFDSIERAFVKIAIEVYNELREKNE